MTVFGMSLLDDVTRFPGTENRMGQRVRLLLHTSPQVPWLSCSSGGGVEGGVRVESTQGKPKNVHNSPLG